MRARDYYEIRFESLFGRRWSEWFDGLSVSQGENGDTILFGPLEDQAALHGVLAKIRDFNLKLISVNRVTADRVPQEDDGSSS